MTDKIQVVTMINNKESLLEIDKNKLFTIKRDLILGIDGSTTNTGIGLIDYVNGSILGSIALTREQSESAVRYKVRFKEYMVELLSNLNIKNIFYEQPFINSNFPDTVRALFMLRSSIDEIKIEQEPKFDSVEHIEVPNTKWKSALLPSKLPSGTEAQKKAVRNYILNILPILSGLSEDEYDGIGLGIAGYKTMRGGDASDLGVSKKAKPFKYEVKFIGADDDEDFLEEYSYEVKNYKIPAIVLDNGALLCGISGKGLFNNYVYKEMGDNDMLLILRFSSKHHSSVVLEHRLANLTHYKYIYAIIWRKYRHISRR